MTIRAGDRFMVISRPVATRTRRKLGSRVFQTRPVQYPQQWLPRSSGNPDDKRLKTVKCMTAPTVRAKEGSAENDSDGLDPQQRSARRRFSDLGLNNDLFRLEQSQRSRRQKANTTKRLKSSLIQLVEYKTRKNKKRQISRPRPTRIRFPDRRGIKRRSLEGRAARRRKVMRGRTRRRRVAGRRRTVRRRRRRVGLSPRKRRRRKRSESEDSYHRRSEANPGPSMSHENDQMLSEQAKVTVGNLEEGHDEVKDDPLNVKEICRSLVKSMHGIPADCRDVNTKGKNDKPELQRDKKEEARKDRRRKPARIKRRNRRADNTNVSNNRKQYSNSRRVNKRVLKKTRKRSVEGSVKRGKRGTGKTVKNGQDRKDKGDRTRASPRADQSDISASSQSNVSAASQSNVSAASQSNVSAASQSNVSAASQSNVSAASQSNVSAASQSNVSAASQSNVSAASQSNVSAATSSASRKHHKDKPSRRGRGPEKVDSGEHSRSESEQSGHRSLYKKRTKRPDAHRHEKKARSASNKKAAVTRRRNKDRARRKRSSRRSHSGENSKKVKRRNEPARYFIRQDNQNNNQDTEVRWYRVGGRLKRATNVILSGLKRLFVK